HFDYEYFDIVRGNDAIETNPLEKSVYSIPSSSRMIIDNDTEDNVTIYSDDTMYDHESIRSINSSRRNSNISFDPKI
ncbi:23487_t:CDS:1, partial [Racocetra persica]